MRVLDLFSGIGGFSLGLERAGMKTVAFCEIEPFCRRVLAKHWPKVPCYDDVRTLSTDRLRADGIDGIDVICGGFPCQDISIAGKGVGLDGERSGLWREYARLVGEVRPRYVIVENVSALLHRGLGDVLGDLAALGYDTEWHCIPVSAVGATNRRDRIWIVAYADSGCMRRIDLDAGDGRTVPFQGLERFVRRSGGGEDVADSIGIGQQGSWMSFDSCDPAPRISRETVDDFNGRIGGVWATEPDVCRVAHWVPAWVDRLRALGNAVVPQIPEMIGRALMEAA